MKDWVGNNISSYVCNGASSHSEEVRQKDDYYATDPEAVKELLKRESFSDRVWECAVGGGHISEVLSTNGYFVESSDIVDRGYPNTKIIDFLQWNQENEIDIITNPPYKYAKEFVKHSLDISKGGGTGCDVLETDLFRRAGKKRTVCKVSAENRLCV